MEEVLRAEEAPRRAVLHSQEPVQEAGGVSGVSTSSSFWWDV